MREGKTKIRVPAKGGTGTLYIPADVIKDSTFPFKNKEEVQIRIQGQKLIVENTSSKSTVTAPN